MPSEIKADWFAVPSTGRQGISRVVFDGDVLTFDVSSFIQAAAELERTATGRKPDRQTMAMRPRHRDPGWRRQLIFDAVFAIVSAIVIDFFGRELATMLRDLTRMTGRCLTAFPHLHHLDEAVLCEFCAVPLFSCV